MDPVHLELKDGPKVAAALRAAPGAMKKELRKSARETAKIAGKVTRGDAKAGSAQQARMAGGIGWSANSTQAIMTLRNTAGAPGAMGAFLGAKQYPQFPAAIAPNWKPATVGEGPLVINPSLARNEPTYDTIFLQGQADVLARLLPR